MTQITAACIQMRSSDSIEENVQSASSMIAEAAANGATLIVTPEMTSLLDKRPGALFEKATAEETDIALPEFRRLARQLSVQLIIGSLPIRISESLCANRSYFITKNGVIAARYDKIHMFNARVREGEIYRESDRFRPGAQLELVKLDDYSVGLTVCYDLRFPEVYRGLAKAGADIITVPSSFTKTTGEAHWHVLLRARAIESGSFVLAPAQGGTHADGRETYGHSLIIDPWGTILAEGSTEPGVIASELDLGLVGKVRERVPSLEHDRQFTINTTSVP